MGFAKHNRCRYIACVVAAFVILLALTPFMRSQAPADNALLHLAVHDSSGKPVADATVYAEVQPLTAAAKQTPTAAHTDADGNCSFSDLRPGVYAVRVEKAGYTASTLPAFSLAAKETRSVDITISPEKTTPPAVAPEFFDTPHFTVSGVTDTTSIGGHGSDAVVRSRESLAKETVALGDTNRAPAAESAAEKSLREKVEREPTGFAANRDLGKLLLAEGKPRDALNYLEHAAKAARAQTEGDQSRPDQAELHHLLARAQELLGNPLDAVREYQRAAELEASEPNLFDWGSELLLHHAPEPAVEVFTKGNHLFPRSVRMLMGLGAAWFASGSFGRAVELVCRASDLDPADPIPYKFLAEMQSTQTLTSDELVERLRRFATLHPENAAANYYLAVGLWKQRKSSPKISEDPAFVAQVDSLLRTALRLEPVFGAAYLQLGILHAEQKDFSQAIADYQQALRANSPIVDLQMTDVQIEETHYRLAQAYREIGETGKAKAELQLYDQITKVSAEQTARQRREIGQFVYSLRDQVYPSH